MRLMLLARKQQELGAYWKEVQSQCISPQSRFAVVHYKGRFIFNLAKCFLSLCEIDISFLQCIVDSKLSENHGHNCLPRQRRNVLAPTFRSVDIGCVQKFSGCGLMNSVHGNQNHSTCYFLCWATTACY